jgi:oligoribonuclease NrnB/cAMP/cGMP phosphodiesterase (DHH superfamily)
MIKETPKEQEILFLITDLNLTPDESDGLHIQITELQNIGYNIRLQLLDHHGTGKKSAKKYDWYFLDTSRSATLITYEYFVEHYKDLFLDKCEENFKDYVQAVNAVDIWLDHDELFEFGKVCMTLISKSHEINAILFPNQSREYRFYLLEQTLNFINQDNAHIYLDENIYTLKKTYLNMSDTPDTIDNLVSKYLVHTLEDKKEDMTITYKEHKGLLSFSLGSISISANAFLKANPDYDFFVDISRRGKASFRADGNIDVSVLAQKLAGGGGHPNASGAAFKDYQETVIYEDVKQFFQSKLDSLV